MSTISSQNEVVQTIQVGVNDLRFMAQVIQVCASRGAIKAEEMAEVGTFFNRVVQVLQQATPPAAPATANAESGNTTTKS